MFKLLMVAASLALLTVAAEAQSRRNTRPPPPKYFTDADLCSGRGAARGYMRGVTRGGVPCPSQAKVQKKKRT